MTHTTKTAKFQVRVTEEELTRLHLLAKEVDVPLSVFSRMMMNEGLKLLYPKA